MVGHPPQTPTCGGVWGLSPPYICVFLGLLACPKSVLLALQKLVKFVDFILITTSSKNMFVPVVVATTLEQLFLGVINHSNGKISCYHRIPLRPVVPTPKPHCPNGVPQPGSPCLPAAGLRPSADGTTGSATPTGRLAGDRWPTVRLDVGINIWIYKDPHICH